MVYPWWVITGMGRVVVLLVRTGSRGGIPRRRRHPGSFYGGHSVPLVLLAVVAGILGVRIHWRWVVHSSS